MKIGIVSIILEDPTNTQEDFNKIVSQYRHLIKGRMGLPFDDKDIAIIGITVIGEMNDINNFTGKLGMLKSASVKVSIAKREV